MKSIFSLCCVFTVTIVCSQTGNVGIGTTNPQAKFHTIGSVRLDTLKGSGSRIVYANSKGILSTNFDSSNSNTTTFDIPDGTCQGAVSTILVSNMPAPVSSGSIKVKINIIHPHDGDLRIFLIAPTAQVLALTISKGNDGHNFINTVFWDSASQYIPSGNSIGAPFTGTYKPDGTTNFNSCGVSTTIAKFGAIGGGSIIPNGTWRLKVLDDAGALQGDVGYIKNWSISFDNTDPPDESVTSSFPVNVPAITTTYNGGANMIAVAYGNVFSDATYITNSSNNCTLNHSGTGVYQIIFTSDNLSGVDPGALSVNATLFGSTPGFITFGGSTGKLIIRTFNGSGLPADKGFGFSVFKP